MFLKSVTRNGFLQSKGLEVGLSGGLLGSPHPASSPSLLPPRGARVTGRAHSFFCGVISVLQARGACA